MLHHILSIIDENSTEMSDQTYIQLTDELHRIYRSNTNFANPLIEEINELQNEEFPDSIVRTPDYIKMWKADEMLHRDGLPALIAYREGSIKRQIWFNHGKISRSDGPAMINQDIHGNGYQCWFKDGVQHRTDGPAQVVKLDNLIVREIWMQHGQIHRNDGPADLSSVDGVLTESIWYQNGQIHRTLADGPAMIKFNSNGVPISFKYYLNGELHNETNPAIIELFQDGTRLKKERWFNHGVETREDDHPCLIEYDMQGNIIKRIWRENGLIHRDKGPSYQHFDSSELTLTLSWHKVGMLHRDDGPAQIISLNSGQEIHKYYINGTLIRELRLNLNERKTSLVMPSLEHFHN